MRLIDAYETYKTLTEYYNIRMPLQQLALKEALVRVPTVDAELVKHGRWINGKCSECGCDRVITKVYRDDEVAWTATYKDNYCPNCGAKMNNT